MKNAVFFTEKYNLLADGPSEGPEDLMNSKLNMS